VTNTYNRTLLAEIQPQVIHQTIQQARDLLSTQSNDIRDEIREALDQRLQLRSVFLEATECPKHVKEPNVARKPWLDGLEILPRIKSSHDLGRPVDDAFSAKLQRKLASTMPPRPIVQLDFDDAFVHLTRLFKDGAELIDVLNYTDSQCLLVRRELFWKRLMLIMTRPSYQTSKPRSLSRWSLYEHCSRHSSSMRWRFWAR
jgi:hypothetical protein